MLKGWKSLCKKAGNPCAKKPVDSISGWNLYLLMSVIFGQKYVMCKINNAVFVIE